jgi:hypothetical protein
MNKSVFRERTTKNIMLITHLFLIHTYHVVKFLYEFHAFQIVSLFSSV